MERFVSSERDSVQEATRKPEFAPASEQLPASPQEPLFLFKPLKVKTGIRAGTHVKFQ
jgi:hypothetical protein